MPGVYILLLCFALPILAISIGAICFLCCFDLYQIKKRHAALPQSDSASSLISGTGRQVQITNRNTNQGNSDNRTRQEPPRHCTIEVEPGSDPQPVSSTGPSVHQVEPGIGSDPQPVSSTGPSVDQIFTKWGCKVTRKASPRSLTTTNRGLSTSGQNSESDEDRRLLLGHNSGHLPSIRTRSTHPTPEDHSNIKSTAPDQHNSDVSCTVEHQGPCSVHIARSGSIDLRSVTDTTQKPQPPHQEHNSNTRQLPLHRDRCPININISLSNHQTPESPTAVTHSPPSKERNSHEDRQFPQDHKNNMPSAPPYQEVNFNGNRQLQQGHANNIQPEITHTPNETPPPSYQGIDFNEHVPLLLDNDNRRINITPSDTAGHTRGIRRTNPERPSTLYQDHGSDQVRTPLHPDSEGQEGRFGPYADAPPSYEEIFGSPSMHNSSHMN